MGDKYGPLYTDGKTTALQSIDQMHHEIHEGDAFHFAFVDTVMADTETLIISFTTPDTDVEIHLTFWWETKVGGHLEIYEGVSSFAGGSALTPKNMNRNSTNTTVLTETLSNPTPTGGTLMGSIYSFGGRYSGAAAEHSNEIILKKNTKYYFKIIADGNSNAAYLHLDWYEHTKLD